MVSARPHRTRMPAIVQLIAATIFAVAYTCGAYASPAGMLPTAESNAAEAVLCENARGALSSADLSCAGKEESCTGCQPAEVTVSRSSLEPGPAMVGPLPSESDTSVSTAVLATPFLVGGHRMPGAPPPGALTPTALKTVLVN